MNLEQKYLKLEGLSQTIELMVDDRFLEALDFVFANWPFEILNRSENASFLSVVFSEEQYQLSSEHMDKPLFWGDPLNAICEMVVGVAWAQLRQEPELLCLHGAAIEFGGRLVVFPATRRAGKSTLSIALAAAGQKVFTDDFLPVRLSDDRKLLGLSNGISPRLRLPAPETFGERADAYIANRSYIANRQYRYVRPREGELARNGDSAPLGALVYLQREDMADVQLEPITKAEALRDLIVQNFSRAIKADGILKLLNFAASELPIYRLKYHDVDQAIAALQQEFSLWPNDTPQVSQSDSTELFGVMIDGPKAKEVRDIATGNWVQRPDIYVAEAEEEKFLTGRNGESIHLLNNLASAIWDLLSEPISLDETIEIVSSAFPDQPVDQISRDVTKVFESFAMNGLLNGEQDRTYAAQIFENEEARA